jgi:hypothetical protein
VQKPARDPLNELIRRELDSAVQRAVQTGDGIGTAEFESLQRLAKTIELRNLLYARPRSWWPPAILACTLAAISFVLFARVQETEIELDLSLSDLTFSIARDEALTSTAKLLALGVSGARIGQLPDGSAAASDAVSLASKSAGGHQGTVTLAPLLLRSGSRINVRQSEASRQFQLLLKSEGMPVHAAIEGPVILAIPGSPARMVNFPIPKPVLLQGGRDDFALNLTFATPIHSPFSPQLEVRDLSLFRIDQFVDPGSTIVRRISTVLSGVLYFESLNGQERRLRSGEDLYFSQSRGEIRALELADDHIGLKFHGRVKGMIVGAGEGRRSVMPTYLDWLRARHGLTLLWGASLYAYGLAAAALRWWGIRI